MPEFQMNGKTYTEFKTLPYMVQGFIEAMFFTETCNGVDSDDWFTPENQESLEQGTIDGCLPSDMGFNELHPDSLANIIKFCNAFETVAHDLLELAYEKDYDSEQAGRDLWFTSQGHGVGFWDRKELGLEDSDQENYEKLINAMVDAGHGTPKWHESLAERNNLVSIGDKLTKLCQYREAQVWFGDHVENGNEPFVYCEISF